jgi:hypothetical protein
MLCEKPRANNPKEDLKVIKKSVKQKPQKNHIKD